MSKTFDAYRHFLDIPRREQPPDHYRLLDIARFESDEEVIRAAAQRRIEHLRTFQLSKYSDWSEKLLNEVAAAKVCLLDPNKKRAYDLELSEAMRPPSLPVWLPDQPAGGPPEETAVAVGQVQAVLPPRMPRGRRLEAIVERAEALMAIGARAVDKAEPLLANVAKAVPAFWLTGLAALTVGVALSLTWEWRAGRSEKRLPPEIKREVVRLDVAEEPSVDHREKQAPIAAKAAEASVERKQEPDAAQEKSSGEAKSAKPARKPRHTTKADRKVAKAADTPATAQKADGHQAPTGSNDGTATVRDAAGTAPESKQESAPPTVASVTRDPDRPGEPARLATVQPRNGAERKLRTFRGHTNMVKSVAFSPDGRQVLTGSDDTTAILWDATTGKRLRTFPAGAREVSSVAFSPDGRQVLTGSGDATAVLWDAVSGAREHVFQGHTGAVNSVAFSPDGSKVLSGSWDRAAILWNIATGRSIRAFRGHAHAVVSVAFSPDGRQAITGSWDRTAILWETITGRRLQTFRGHTDVVCCVAFGPDGRQVLTGSADATVILWDAVAGARLRTLQPRGNAVVYCAAFSHDGRWLLIGCGDGRTGLWDAATGQERGALAGHAKSVLSIAFSPDDRKALTGSEDRTAVLWDVSDLPRP